MCAQGKRESVIVKNGYTGCLLDGRTHCYTEYKPIQKRRMRGKHKRETEQNKRSREKIKVRNRHFPSTRSADPYLL